MRKKVLLIALLFLLAVSYAAEGDTIVVQTIDHDTPLLPGWNSPRSGFYKFPSDTINFSKILMSYNLKCDPSQSPACGEWDYTTYTKIWEHTGVYDSTLYYHPNYIVNNQSPDSFMMMLSPSFKYTPILEYINQTTPTITAEPGSGDQTVVLPFNAGAPDGRTQFIYTAGELISAGLQSGDLTGMSFDVISGSIELDHLTIRFGHTQQNVLPVHSYVDENLVEVFSRNSTINSANQNIPFSFPFSWDGVQNIIVDISYADHTGNATIKADLSDNNMSIISDSKDSFMDFEGWDYITIPKEALSTVDSAITISFWQYGNSVNQPLNSSIFEAVDSLGRRVLNAHLPWSNGKVYWDAGFDGSDRLLGTANPEDYKGQWNFWTFTKDVKTGLMQILLNGELWNVGNGRVKPIINIEEFRIGSAITYDGYYSGMIDDFRIWDTVLSWDNISDWMYRDITPEHPNYNHLVAYYKFDEGSGTTNDDSSPNNYGGFQFGFPEWMNYKGTHRMKESESNSLRAHLIIENGNYIPADLDSLVVIDTTEITAVNVVLFNPNNPTTALDTLTRWPSYYNNYVYDGAGNAIDSTLVTPDETIYLIQYSYYGEPFEILVPWEIGRFITPYGNNLSLGDDGFTWVYDVTDYRQLLSDTVHITAGNFQELLDLEFHMIEGTPPRDVLKMDKVYSGYWYLHNFDEKVPPDTITLLPTAETFKVRTRTSGHQFDNPTNCAEFCEKIHSLDIDGQLVSEWQILQECSDNPLYPQGGTWIYDRAGWCPGMKVTEEDIEITPYVSGDTVIVDYNSEYDEYGRYVLEVHMFSYGSVNHDFDAAIEEIIAPNNLKRYERFNPSTSAPIIVISNQGSETLTYLEIVNGPAGFESTYIWNGELAFGEKEEITLEPFEWEQWVDGNGNFSATLQNPNNVTDENSVNNTYYSNYHLPPVYPGTIVQKFKTNKAGYQNSWRFTTNDNLTYLARDGFNNETIYWDTISFETGCYNFYLHDTGDNGISFWANSEGSGYLRWYNLEGSMIKNFNGDFGDGIHHNFYADIHLGLDANTSEEISFNIIPNPNKGDFTIRFASDNNSDISCNIYNSQGQLVYTVPNPSHSNNLITISLDNVPSGVYTCVIASSDYSVSKKFVVN